MVQCRFIHNILELIAENEKHVSLNGYLTFFDDGTILYTGPAINTKDHCTGFVLILQGYLDISGGTL